ncbi:MAG: hypothetical protein ABR510_02440 [Trueperaceae bacterium]
MTRSLAFRPWRGALVAMACAALAWAAAQGPSPVDARADGSWTLVAGDDLARALGAAWSDDGRAFTLRVATGVLTVFEGDVDALWQPAGGADPTVVSAALPARRIDDRWYVPEDLLGVLGARVDGALLHLPGGATRPLLLPRTAVADAASELVPLGPGVEALRLFVNGGDGDASVSLLVVDLGLLALAFPAQQSALDAVLRDLSAERALFLTVTATAQAAWQPAIYVVQNGRETLLAEPFAVQVLAGDPARVAPGEPVVAVAFLPDHLDLRRPLTVRWAGVSGTWTLRR